MRDEAAVLQIMAGFCLGASRPFVPGLRSFQVQRALGAKGVGGLGFRVQGVGGLGFRASLL